MTNTSAVVFDGVYVVVLLTTWMMVKSIFMLWMVGSCPNLWNAVKLGNTSLIWFICFSPSLTLMLVVLFVTEEAGSFHAVVTLIWVYAFHRLNMYFELINSSKGD